MIKQRGLTLKVVSSSLTYLEMGDIVCNSAAAITITLPAPNLGLWYRISNVGAGIVTVYYGSALTTLKQTEQCLGLANSSTDWFFSKGGSGTKKGSANIGDAVATVFNIAHNLNTLDTTINLRELATGSLVLAEVQTIDVNTVRISFASAPSANQYRVTVVG